MDQQQQPQPPVVAPIPAQQWAQCENPNCNKWRLLPAGAVLNENEPWYCYMNPDPEKNTCEAPEAEYDETNEVILEANYQVPETALVLPKAVAAQVVTTSAPGVPKPKPKGKKRGRPKGAKNHTGVGGDPRQRMVSFADDDDLDDMIGGGGQRRGDGVDSGRKMSAKYLVNILNSMVDGPFGSSSKGSKKKNVPSPSSPIERPVPIEDAWWEALCKMAPDSAPMACEYADIFSSLSLMNGQFPPAAGSNTSGATAPSVISESSSVEMQLRLAAMFAAAKGLTRISDGMSLQDRTEWDVIDDSGFHPINQYQ